MDPDIQFGEVEEARPTRRRRPDRDRHFAVREFGTPAEEDLPIFVDMDVLAEMEAHARSDPTVELGGVLLGGQFEDDEGKPFVVVLDSLRAQHYESSSGHFKFTHDTWSEISRQRDEFSDDLQMVGWYHTHPNWGVFLSGMDQFICDHFFNRPLDVALVMDPVRGDRGWFYWDRGGGKERLPRASGFSVIASRFRRHELASRIESLERDGQMEPESVLEGSRSRAGLQIPQHVIHTIRPPQLGWIGAAVLATLVLQLCATLLIALRIGAPATIDPRAFSSDRSGQQGQISQLDRREQLVAAREEAFEKLVGDVKADPEGKVNVKSLVDENQKLRSEVARVRKTDLLLGELTTRFEQVSNERSQLETRISSLQKSNEELQGTIEKTAALRDEDKKASEREITQLKMDLAKLKAGEREKSAPSGEEGKTTATSGLSSPQAEGAGAGIPTGKIVGAVVVLLAIGALAAAIVRTRRRITR
jgi:proteasome lid subunit RPN8/RPN11/regulator of replication initiation timing